MRSLLSFVFFGSQILNVASLDPASKGNTALLTTNTEVSISPKLHKRKETAIRQSNISEIPPSSRSQKQIDQANLWHQLNFHVLRVLPVRLAPSLSYMNHSGPELLAFVSSKTFSQLQSHKSDLEFSMFVPTEFKRLQPPSSVDVSPSFTHTDVARKEDHGQINDKADLYIGIEDGIITGHIVFPAPPKEVEDWDLVRYLTLMDRDLFLNDSCTESLFLQIVRPSNWHLHKKKTLPPRGFLLTVVYLIIMLAIL